MMKAARPPLKLNTIGGAGNRQTTRTGKFKVVASRSKEHGNRSGGASLGRAQHRTSSANGPSQQSIRPQVQLLPDTATVNMANLKRVKFLDPEFEAPTRQREHHAAVYANQQKKKTMDRSLQRVIDGTRVAHMQVLKKSAKEIESEKKAHVEELANNPLAKLMETAKPKNDPSHVADEDKFADGFIRSKRNTHLRVKQELLSQIRSVEEAKTALIQKLNKALIKLDKQNQDKREIGEKLLEQVKFVRDLQRAASNGDDIEGVVSVQLKTDFQREKELNLRLREELQRCEKERLRLLERIKLLSGEKEIEVENTDGVRRTFKVTQINIQRILDELRSQKDTMVANEDLVRQSAEMCRAAEEEIATRNEQIDQLRFEKDEAEAQYIQLESKYKDTMYLNEGAREHMGGLHRMHVKLLATRQLEEALQKAFDRTRKSAIDQTLWVTRGYVNQFGAIYRLRNLILHRNSRQKKNALALWFKLACDPMMLLEQNRQIPEYFAKRHTERLVFNREFEQWMLNQNHRQQQNSQLDAVKGKLANFWRRELKLRFNMWKDNVFARNSGIKVIDKLCTKTRYTEIAKAFTKWQIWMKEQDFTCRLHGMAVMTAQMQTQTSVFYGWRMVTHASKTSRQALMRRCLRNLRKGVDKRKQLQKMAISALVFQNQSEKSILQQCWSALRQNKENEKLIFLNDKLNAETQPALESLTKDLQSINQRDMVRSQKRATSAFVTVFGRLLSQYFQKWKNTACSKSIQMNQSFKIKLIKLYRDKLAKAFNLWKMNKQAMTIDMQTMEFEDLQAQNQEIEAVCKQNDLKIKAADRSSKGMGAKHIKKLVTAAYQRNMKAYLDKWRNKNQKSVTQTNTTEHVIQKCRRRLLRMAWNRYRYGVNCREQEDRNEGKLSEVKIRLDFKQKKRIYNAIKDFTRKYRIAKRFVKSLINGLDKHNKDCAFRRWKDFNKGETIMTFEEQQTELVQQMNDMQQLESSTADKLMRSKDKCARVSQTLHKQGQATLRKWVNRLTNQSLHYGFQRWKQNAGNLNHRESLITSIKRQLDRNTQRQAWVRWGQACGKFNLCSWADQIEVERRLIESNKLKVQAVMDKRRLNADRNQNAMENIDSEKKKMTAIAENTMARLINKNQTCYHTTKLNHIFHGWKTYMDRRRKCCKILTDALHKTALSKAMIRINQFQRNEHMVAQQAKASNKLCNFYSKFRLKSAMSKWREQEYQNVCMLQMQTTEEMGGFQEDWAIKKNNIKKHHVAVKNARVQKQTAKDWFVAWQIYASEERDCRLRTQNLRQALNAKAAAKALQKWRLRSEKTIKLRAFLKRGKFVKKQCNLKSAFQAWKQENRNERALTNKIYAVMENLRNLSCQSAFDMIKRYALEKHSMNGQNKLKGKAVLIRACENYSETKLRAYFNKMRQNRDRCVARETRMKNALCNLNAGRIRSYFLNWKMKANQIAIHLQNEEEDGPMNLEAWQLRQDNFNLIRLMKEDGLTNQEIQKVHQQSEEKYKAGVEKSLCRLLCKQNQGLELLPICLEQWKKYAKIRKVWRRVLKDLQIRAEQGDEMSAKLWAFRRLQYSHEDRQACLWGKQIAELRKKCVENVEKLDKLADLVEVGENEANELTGQRNLLIKGQVSGQKLALSLSVQNQDRTKMYAFSKFAEAGNKNLQNKIEQAIKANLNKITGLKDNISKFETENEELAKQNDEFRKGALDGITMVRHVEGLTADRDKLSVDLADKALTIRKLLEDNQYLQNKLTNAQAQASVILDHAKKQAMAGLEPPVREQSSPTLVVGDRENSDPNEVNAMY